MALTAEEVKDAEKTLPRTIIISLTLVFVFYSESSPESDE